MPRSLHALVDHLTRELHHSRRRLAHESSSNIAASLRAIRQDIDALRAEAGLPPSPLAPTYPEEEEE